MKDRQKIREILSNDCKTNAFYVAPDDDQCTCAVGALALAAGVSLDILKKASASGIDFGIGDMHSIVTEKQIEAVTKIRNAIKATFGLTVADLKALQRANDSVSGREVPRVKERREKVLAVFDSLPDVTVG